MQHIRTPLAVLLIALVAATQLGNGCVSDSGDYDSPSRPDTGYDQNDRIPSRAELVEEGREQLRFRAKSDGRVYLYETQTRRILGSAQIARGREFIVSPKDNRAWIDDKRVLDVEMNLDHVHRIYFLPVRNRPDDDSTAPAKPSPAKPEPTKPQPGKPTGPVFGGGAGATVPKSASIAREGKGSDLSFEASGVGTVFIYDVDAKTVIASYNLKKGQRFTVSPETGEAAVDGEVVIRKPMSVKKTYRLYFNLNV